MWLTCAGATRHLRPGDTFELAHAAEHAERYGPEGATYWAARRNATPELASRRAAAPHLLLGADSRQLFSRDLDAELLGRRE